MRAKPLYPEALAEALQALLPALPPDMPRHAARALCASVVRSYLMVAGGLEGARMDYRIAPLSRALAALEVGAAMIAPAMPTQCVRGRMSTARKLMDNPAATWRSETLPDGRIKVTRRDDGATTYARDLTKNAKAMEMAALKPGESVWSRTIATSRGRGQMGSNAKVAARKLLGAPRANWTVRTVGDRVRLTRTA